MDNKNYSRQCKLVIRKTAGATDVKTDDAADGVRLISFSTTVNMSQHSGGNSYRPEEIKFKLHVKEALRQVAIHSKPSWSMPMRLLKTAREFVTRANFRLSIGIIDMDDCGDVSFKTAAEFGAINDISQVLTSLMEVHTGSGLDCFRALEAMKDRDVSATDALAFVTRKGTSNEGVDDHLANMLTVLSQPS